VPAHGLVPVAQIVVGIGSEWPQQFPLAYILATFTSCISFSAGAAYWAMQRESEHFTQLLNMMVTPKITPKPTPALTRRAVDLMTVECR
jgi:hypothetical protein